MEASGTAAATVSAPAICSWLMPSGIAHFFGFLDEESLKKTAHPKVPHCHFVLTLPVF